MCKICDGTYNNEIYLDVSGCLNLTEINLNNLNYNSCPGETSLSKLHELSCYNCLNLKDINICNNIIRLNCQNCPKLEKIHTNILCMVNCYNCSNLKEIHTNKIHYLNCHNCSNLTKIRLDGLEKLDCHNCPNLKEIPLQNKIMDYFNCYGQYYKQIPVAKTFIFGWK